PRMGDMAVRMLKRSLEAFISRDAGLVRTLSVELEKEDDEVDDLYAKVQTDLLELVKADPENAEPATYLMRVAHNVERVADRAMNIVERALYQATGELVSGSTQIEPIAE
ncbi:MAG: phosphate uptake regulator PhoU, partial [SAR202 cluster bacterium]